MTFMRTDAHTLSRSIRIAASPTKVWELITTVARITEWYDTWDAVEHAPDQERLREGMSFRLVRRRMGRDDTALCRVTAVEAPWRLCWLQHARRLPPMSVEFQLFADIEGATGTWVKHTRTWIRPGQPLS
jgi:uncharacterized protein YndB with AHSA1/START domain